MKSIVGYTGFVGSNLLQFYNFDSFYNSKNFKDANNMEFDEMYFCGIPAVKWYANKYPEEDTNVINNIIDILKTIKVKKFILISTIDVYEDVNSEKTESYECNYNLNHTYGKNRFIFEQFIKSQFNDYHIIRLPALFGKGLKKNIIYDLLNRNEIHNISINTSFQWYNLDWLKQDINYVISNDIKVCNLFTEPLDTINIIKLFDYNLDCFEQHKKIKYNLKTEYYNGYIRNKETVEASIKEFIKFYKYDKSQLVVSNICVKNISQLQFACILKLFGITNIQIAPTTITSWENLHNIDMSIYKNNNINVYSFQSITFTLNHLNIFNDMKNILMQHIKNVIDVASKNNVKVLVFGCPRNRYILDNNDNTIIFIDFFKELGDYLVDKNVIICIEPNSKKYNCNFLNTVEEVGSIVRKINKDNIKMMVDLGNIIMENDNIETLYDFSDIIYNIDIAEENMSSFINPNNINYKFKNILDNINYNKKINLEMLCSNNELDDLIVSLNNFITIYSHIK